MNHTAPDYYAHPVFHPEQLHLDTRAMQALREVLHRWLWTGATGGLILGAARTGKTRALRTLRDQLFSRGGTRIPVVYVSIPTRDQHTVLSVYRQLCLSARLTVRAQDRADHLAERYLHYLADQAAAADCPHVVVLVDEMQRLTPAQFGPFTELHDQLALIDINLTVVFIGNDQESARLLAAIEQPAFAHVRGRFFTQHVPFYGLCSQQEVQFCLSQYDTLRFPAEGPTYTGYFLPEAVARGWCLRELSHDLWRVFHDYQTRHHLSSWGMQYFTAAVNTLLADFLPHSRLDAVDDELLHECIQLSGLIPSLVQPVP